MKHFISFPLALMLVAAACNNAPSSKTKSMNASDASLAQSGRFAVDTKSSISDLSKEDARIAAEVQRSQDFSNRITKEPTKSVEKMRLDHFFKCKTRLAHSYLVMEGETDAETSSFHLAERLKGSLLTISTNVRSMKLGAYEAYSAVKDKNQRLFVFFQAESDRFVYYSFMDGTKPWISPIKLAEKVGLPTATYNAATQAIVVTVLGIDDMKNYTFTQDGDKFQSAGTPSASSQEAFDKLQKANGSAMEITGVTLNSIPPAADPAGVAGIVMGRIMQFAITFGASEIARATYQEEEMETTKLFQSLQSTVCQ